MYAPVMAISVGPDLMDNCIVISRSSLCTKIVIILSIILFGVVAAPWHVRGALVAQWVKRWPTDQADRVRSSLKAKSSRP